MLLFALIAPAFPCAGLLTSSESLATSDAQEVIFSHEGSNTKVEYKVSFSGDAESFGWVIPIFGDFVSLEDGSEDRFNLLRERTQPEVYYQYAQSNDGGSSAPRTCGCGETMMAGKGMESDLDAFDDSLSNDIEITAEGFTGSYEYTVISASEPESLAPWLSENGWETGMTQPSLDAYAQEEGVQFVLIKLSNVEYNADKQDLPPVGITYAGTDMRFPAMMARYGQGQVRTRIYVTGDESAQMSGWTETVPGEITGDFNDDPKELFDEAILAASGDVAGYLNVYTGPYYSYDGENLGWVSRFETLANPGAHTLDPVFTLDGGIEPEAQVRPRITLIETAEEDSAAGTYLLLPFLLLGVGWTRRKFYK